MSRAMDPEVMRRAREEPQTREQLVIDLRGAMQGRNSAEAGPDATRMRRALAALRATGMPDNDTFYIVCNRLLEAKHLRPQGWPEREMRDVVSDAYDRAVFWLARGNGNPDEGQVLLLSLCASAAAVSGEREAVYCSQTSLLVAAKLAALTSNSDASWTAALNLVADTTGRDPEGIWNSVTEFLLAEAEARRT